MRFYKAERGQKVTIDENGERHVTVFGDSEELLKHVEHGDWNDYRIIARGNEVTLEINGVIMSQAVDRERGRALHSGIIALQLHEGPPMKVQFKDIRIKTLTGG